MLSNQVWRLLCGFDSCLVNQQNGNAIPNGKGTPALRALKARLILRQINRGFTDGARQDVEQVFGDHRVRASGPGQFQAVMGIALSKVYYSFSAVSR